MAKWGGKSLANATIPVLIKAPAVPQMEALRMERVQKSFGEMKEDGSRTMDVVRSIVRKKQDNAVITVVH